MLFTRNRDGFTTEALSRRALRNILIIAAVGTLLILADLMNSRSHNDIEIVRDDSSSRIYLLRPDARDPAGHLSLRARVRAENKIYEKNLDLTLSPYTDSEDDTDLSLPDDNNEENEEEDRIMFELRSIISDMNRDRSMTRLLLPNKLSGGETITWVQRSQNHTLLLLILMAFSAVIVYRNRFLPMDKKIEEQRQSILANLPDFIHRTVLLLNAGLVFSEAFERAVTDAADSESMEHDYFSDRMKSICDSMRNTNSSFTAELRNFAKESGVGELMRISSIITDNINKGSELTKKLEDTSETLWLTKKLKCEERGRLAETKMSLPLSIFLGVLILITVSPALLEL